ncbi:hypothetical protein NDU88_007125 [Pleurodeles waltl]|uniref:Uncharacterized protein n=1 Tax=Pleurodeles waltl TaxID=8319 RepID=A0AAV7U097_PLEWA|nr:hypothetical protein NDU88_007125 [Pleurodeles waltl]
MPPVRVQQPVNNKQGSDCPSVAQAAASRAKQCTEPFAVHLAVHHPSNSRAAYCPENTATAPKLPAIMPRSMRGRAARAAVAAVNNWGRLENWSESAGSTGRDLGSSSNAHLGLGLMQIDVGQPLKLPQALLQMVESNLKAFI